MPNIARGEKPRKNSDGSYTVRITVDDNRERKPYTLGDSITTDGQAEKRRDVLAALALRFRRAGKANDLDALKLLDMAAACADALLPGVDNAAALLLGGQVRKATAAKAVQTFEQVGKDWTDGVIAKNFPQHVKVKKSEWDTKLDAGRLKKLCEIDVGGVRGGDVPIDQFTLEHAEAMLRSLPESAESDSTRRQYASLIGRIITLAVYPLKLIKVSPLPKNFMPKVSSVKSYPYLYPDNDRALMANKDVPLALRVAFGFMAREGSRKSEAGAFLVRDFDLELGKVRLDENKTDDPRSWSLQPGTHRALKAWVKLRGLQPDDFMFHDEHGRPITRSFKGAERLRAALLASGVDRYELHHDGKNTGKLRLHDLRSTFITLSLATGRPEKWITARTGHQSSAQLNDYDRQKGEAEELNLGELAPLDEAIPELSSPNDGPMDRSSAVNSAGPNRLAQTTPHSRAARCCPRRERRR